MVNEPSIERRGVGKLLRERVSKSVAVCPVRDLLQFSCGTGNMTASVIWTGGVCIWQIAGVCQFMAHYAL